MGRILQQYKKLFDALKKGGPKPIYFLYGPEVFIKKEFVSEIIRTALPAENRAFNLDVLQGDEFDADLFNDRMSTFPLFNERRVLIVKRFEKLSTKQKDEAIKQLDNAPQSIVFVVETDQEKLDTVRMKNMNKAADAHGGAHKFQELSDGETIEWVRSRLHKEGLAIDPEALDMLVEAVGTRLIDLVNEIDKIVLAADADTPVSPEIVSAVVGRYRSENLFAFLDHLGERQAARVLRRMNRVLDGGEEPVFVLAMLLRRVLLLLQIKTLIEDEGPRLRNSKAMAGRLAGLVSPFFAGRLMEQAGRFETAELSTYLVNLRWADQQLKSTANAPRSLLETALLASAGRKKLAHSNPA